MTDQHADTAPDAPRPDWPWHGDYPPSRSGLAEASAQQHDDGTVALAWDRPDATCTIVSRDVLDAVVEERNQLVRQVAEADQRAELLRRQVEELTREREEAVTETERLGFVLRTRCGDLERWLDEALDGWANTDDEGTHGQDPTDRILEIRREAGLT